MEPIIIDNSGKVMREFNNRVDEALREIGEIVVEEGPAYTPVKTGATLASEAFNVFPIDKLVEIGAGTSYAPDIMTGANRSSGIPNPFLIRMLMAAVGRLIRVFDKE